MQRVTTFSACFSPTLPVALASTQSIFPFQNMETENVSLNGLKANRPSSPVLSAVKRRAPTENDLQEPLTKKAKEELMEMLECPVCHELPRTGNGPIFGCRNGHTMCQSCVDKVEECPVCREKDVRCRSILTERIIEKQLQDVEFKCKHVECLVKRPLKDLAVHEKFCPHREVACPSSHRSACKWRGTLTKLVSHIKEKKCVQVVFDEKFKKEEPEVFCEGDTLSFKFKSSVGDFPVSQTTVFKRNNTVTHWKPVVLLAKPILNLWCYVLIQRDAEGNWTLVVYSMLAKDLADKIQVKIKVGGPPQADRSFTFEGKAVSCEMDRNSVLKLGHYLRVSDSQLNPFQMPNQTSVFHYQVEVNVHSQFMIEMYKAAKALEENETE